MREWFALITENAVLLIDVIALLTIVFGTVQAFIGALHLVFVSPASHVERGVVWLRFARWLVAGLTFQLAADIIETAIAPGWDEIGRLAAVAVIRTFLDYFLERDMTEVREHRQAPSKGPDAGQPGRARGSRK
jgi:uncharacterized membrane protein